MNELVTIWVLTVSLWSENEVKVLYKHEFKDIQECVTVSQGQIQMYESDPKKNKNEYIQASCTPK